MRQLLKRFRGRFGPATRKLAIRPHVPWYWRGLRVVVMIGVTLALAGWMYDLGRSFAGFQHHESQQALDDLAVQLAQAQAELVQAKSAASGSESALQIERSAQHRLAEQVKQLEIENSQTKEELAAMESLVAGGGKLATAPSIARLTVTPDAGGRYRFHALMTAPAAVNGTEIDAALQVLVSMIQGGKAVMLSFPVAGASDVAQYQVRFHKFLRYEGSFQVPPEAKVSEVELRLLVKGGSQAARKITL